MQLSLLKNAHKTPDMYGSGQLWTACMLAWGHQCLHTELSLLISANTHTLYMHISGLFLDSMPGGLVADTLLHKHIFLLKNVSLQA
jgi:hypothetical protein